MLGWGVRQSEIDKERRLALLLADGTGDFDFVLAVAIQNVIILEGKVKDYRDKERAEEFARYVGFDDVMNTIRVSL